MINKNNRYLLALIHMVLLFYYIFSVLPPSTLKTCPVMNEAASDAKKTTTLAASSGLPILPNGVRAV